jgi:malate synthase
MDDEQLQGDLARVVFAAIWGTLYSWDGDDTEEGMRETCRRIARAVLVWMRGSPVSR